MNDSQFLRMLLSHNFDITDEQIPTLSRTAFTQVFIDGFGTNSEITCRQVDNPHWIVEIICPIDLLTPQQIGTQCAQILASSRTKQGAIGLDILVLGGIKTTPAMAPAPSLQPGEWGVDVVETKSAEQFKRSINWDGTVATKPADSIFHAESQI